MIPNGKILQAAVPVQANEAGSDPSDWVPAKGTAAPRAAEEVVTKNSLRVGLSTGDIEPPRASICARTCAQQWQDSRVNGIVRESRQVYAAVQTPMLDLLGGLSGRQLGQRSERLHLQKFIVGKSLERAPEVGIRFSRICVSALDEY